MEPFSTIGEIVDYVENHFDNPKALNYQHEGTWKHVSTKEFVETVRKVAYGLIKIGMKPGDKVGILANSSANWTIVDFAVIMAGGITVPLFANLSDENFIFEVAQANIRYLFVEGHKQWQMYEEHYHLFQTVISFQKAISLETKPEAEEAYEFSELVTIGDTFMQEKPGLLAKIASSIHADDVATIVYTSGSTGVPKGAEITHRNLVHLIQFGNLNWSENDRYLSILPLAHIFARQLNYIMIAWGGSVYYLTELSGIAKAFREVNPTFMIVVPRLLEKIRTRISMQLSKENYLKQWIAKKAFALAEDPDESFLKRYLYRPLAKLFVYRPIMKQFGNSFRMIFSGGAALDPKLETFFQHLGFPILQGWGLTEASTATINLPTKNKIGTVGPPLPGVKIKIAENGEILLSSPTVMKGFYRRRRATEAAIDADGWLHTGDKGEIDKDGYLKITGRLKRKFKLSTGEYVSPEKIERLLRLHTLVDMAFVVGEGHSAAACLLFPDIEVVHRLKQECQATDLTDEEFLESEEMQKQTQAIIDQVNGKINQWERIAYYRLILEPLSVEKGELTPSTMKIRREVVLDKYHDLIESIYEREEVA
ncbi:MAG: long-chain fatty acid--CoA ligase [Waddliaceae bacterium]